MILKAVDTYPEPRGILSFEAWWKLRFTIPADFNVAELDGSDRPIILCS
ncbi:MAG: hypothetical protein AAFX78_14395 [Cyanobacteria bacterium J06638_20]